MPWCHPAIAAQNAGETEQEWAHGRLGWPVWSPGLPVSKGVDVSTAVPTADTGHTLFYDDPTLSIHDVRM